MDLTAVEEAIAAEAAAHGEAASALNPYADAEALALGRAQLVYSGTFSPVHGVYGLGLDGPPDENDWREIDRFFARKERPPVFWLTPFTDPAVKEKISATHRPTKTILVSGEQPHAMGGKPFPGPDHSAWALAFRQSRAPGASEPDLLALTKLHQKNTRFYLEGGRASYTFFHRGIALVPFPPVLPLQQKEVFLSSLFVVMGEAGLPPLYERTLYEPV
jgi:hypothetical protein